MQPGNDGLRVVTLNIDWNKNLKRVLPFLAERRADIACLQEVRKDALPALSRAAGEYYFFAPMTLGSLHGAPCPVGIALFSRLPLRFGTFGYYVGDPRRIVELKETSEESRRKTTARAVAFCGVEKDGVRYTVATTHFTWTGNGKPDEFQRKDLQKLLDIVHRAGECVLCGDFNAPRGGEIFTTLSQSFTDNVPPCYTSSLDPETHHLKQVKAMVDGIFSTPAYTVSGVQMHSGISDHCALEGVVQPAGH